MATQYYFTARSPGVDYRQKIQSASWDAAFSGPRLHSMREYMWLLDQSKTLGGTGGSILFGETNDTPNWDMLVSRWMTPALDAQAVSGTFDLIMPSLRSDLASTVVWRVYIYISMGDGAGIRATLLDYVDPTDWSVAGQGRALAAAQALTPGNTLAGDHVIIELGARFVTNPFPVDNVTIFDTTARIWAGTTDGGGASLADATVGGATTRAPFCTFSHTFVELPVVGPPSNDACADAMVIPSLPFTITQIDTTQSTDAARAVWFEWTAPDATRVFFSTFGSNYECIVRVFTGGCGGLTSVTTANRGQWLQMDQTVATWIPTAGVTYLIRVTGNPTGPAGSLNVALTAYSAPLADDLYVNCQSITAWRAGVMINHTDGFYNFTPTGSAIDYTLRPLNDFNGGVHTDLRLLVVLFDSPLVEYLDLATLNLGQSEVDFIDLENDPPANALPGDTHLSSVVMDRPGDILTGSFGDEYDVIGGLGSPNSVWPRRVNPLVTFNSPGVAPFAQVLDFYTTQQEVQGSDYVELSSDQRTLFYTSAGRTIFRYDLVTKVQLAPFATLPVEAGPRPGLRGTRLLPPGDGSGGLLVCDGINIKRLDSAGQVVQVYTPGEPNYAQDIDKVEVSSDGTIFWATDQLSTRFFKFNLASGAELQVVDPQLPPGQLCGFTIYQGYRAGLESPPGGPPTPGPPGYIGIPSGGGPPTPGGVTGTGCPTDFPIDAGGSGDGCSVPFFP